MINAAVRYYRGVHPVHRSNGSGTPLTKTEANLFFGGIILAVVISFVVAYYLTKKK